MSHYMYDKALEVKFHRDLAIKASKKKSIKDGFWKRKLVEFCKRTDLHGYKYIVMEGLNKLESCHEDVLKLYSSMGFVYLLVLLPLIFEESNVNFVKSKLSEFCLKTGYTFRSCWALAVLLSTIFAAYFVVTAYKWYARNPIITVIESTQGAIWDIPFPAVTICDLNTISKRAARSFANNMTLPPNVTADFVFETVRMAPLLHSSYVTTADQKKHLHILQQVLDLNNISMERFFKTLSPAMSCSRLLQRCMWKNTIYRCDQLFQQMFTMFQLCCTFNYYAVVPDVKKALQNRLLHHANPRRVASCGYQTALTVLLRNDPDDYYSSMVPSQGALVYIDSAYNLPNLDSPVRMVNPGTEVLIALSPERTYTTSGIRSFSPEQRQCYYSDEVKVADFSQYSLHNCIAFYKVEKIKKTCECVPFFFPIKEYPRLCNFDDLECLEMALKNLSDDKLEIQYKKQTFTCLPECEHYDYPIEVAMGKLATHMKLTGLPFFNNVNLTNRSLLNVFFNDLVSIRFRRDVYFNWQNFTAAFGGLLSLMLGFTLISGFDLIFFFTLRLAYESKMKSSRKKKTKPHNENEKKVNNWMEKSMQNRKLSVQDFGNWRAKNSFAPRYKLVADCTQQQQTT